MPGYAKLRSDLISASIEIDGQTVYNIKDPKTGNYFRLREPEYWLIQQLDGVSSYDEIADNFKRRFNLNISTKDVEQFVTALEKQFFLENSRSEQVLSRKSYLKEEKRSLFSRLLFVKIKAFSPGIFLDKLTSLYKPFHTPVVMVMQLVLIIIGGSVLLANASYFAVNLYEIFNLGSILTIILTLFILVTLHEFAHAVICRYYGGEVREMGFLLLYFQPCFYSNLSDAWLFRSKRHRLAVTFAGPYFQLILLATAVVIWRITVVGTIINELARIFGIVAWVTLLFNLNPLIKLDGYYLLSDWLDIPNLRKKSFRYLNNLFKRRVLGWHIKKIETSLREKRIYLIYSVLAAIYSVALIIYFLVILAGFLLDKMGGVGLILLLVVLFYTLRMNIVDLFKGIIQHLVYMKDIFKKPLRLFTYVTLIIVFIVLFFIIQFPHRVTGEITVQPIAEFNLLINNFGLLEKKFYRGGANSENKSSYIQMASSEMASLDLIPSVKDGQKVNDGDTLAILISNQVTREIVAEKSVLEKLESDLALLKSPPKKEEVDEAVAEVKAAQAVYEQKLREEKRYRELTEKNLSSQEELETIQSETEVARAELENKKAKLRLLKSPPKPEEEAGIISEIEKQKAKLDFLQNQLDAQSIISPIPGTIVISQKGKLFLSVIDNQKVEILVPVSDFDINLIQLNQNVKFKVRSFTGNVFEGRVVHIPKDATVLNRRAFFFVSTVIDNDDNSLHKGMTGYAKIEVGKVSLFKLVIRKLISFIRVEFWSWW